MTTPAENRPESISMLLNEVANDGYSNNHQHTEAERGALSRQDYELLYLKSEILNADALVNEILSMEEHRQTAIDLLYTKVDLRMCRAEQQGNSTNDSETFNMNVASQGTQTEAADTECATTLATRKHIIEKAVDNDCKSPIHDDSGSFKKRNSDAAPCDVEHAKFEVEIPDALKTSEGCKIDNVDETDFVEEGKEDDDMHDNNNDKDIEPTIDEHKQEDKGTSKDSTDCTANNTCCVNINENESEAVSDQDLNEEDASNNMEDINVVELEENGGKDIAQILDNAPQCDSSVEYDCMQKQITAPSSIVAVESPDLFSRIAGKRMTRSLSTGTSTESSFVNVSGILEVSTPECASVSNITHRVSTRSRARKKETEELFESGNKSNDSGRGEITCMDGDLSWWGIHCSPIEKERSDPDEGLLEEVDVDADADDTEEVPTSSRRTTHIDNKSTRQRDRKERKDKRKKRVTGGDTSTMMASFKPPVLKNNKRQRRRR